MLIALLLTIIIECLALFLLRERRPVFYLFWIALTTLTNLTVNLCVSLVNFGSMAWYVVTVLVMEVLVFVSEAFIAYLYTENPRQSLIYSAVCNLASFLVGGIIVDLINSFV